jgi:hypothetical protein
MSPPFSGSKNKPNKEISVKQIASRAGGDKLLQNGRLTFKRTAWRYIPEERIVEIHWF